MQYNSNDEDQSAILKGVAAGCDTREADKPMLREAGHLMYNYTKKYENQGKCVAGKQLKISATGKLEDHGKTGEEVWEQASQMLKDQSSSSSSTQKRHKVGTKK